MSIISSTHSVVPFISGETKAMHGQRLAKVGYKSSKTQPAKYKSVAVSLPPMDKTQWIESLEALVPHINEMIQNAQDGIVKSLYESAGGKLEVVLDSEIGIAQVLGFLEAESTGGRLTKELITAWFTADAEEYTAALLAEKLGYPEELNDDQKAVIGKHLNGYKECFILLAGGRNLLSMAQINGLRKVLDMLEPETDVVLKMKARLCTMEAEHNKVNELALFL